MLKDYEQSSGSKKYEASFAQTVSVQILSFEELKTLLFQIAEILNYRPLASMSSDPNDVQSITPPHFPLCKSAKDLSTASQPDDNINLARKLKLLGASKWSLQKAWFRDNLVTPHISKRRLPSGPLFQLGDLI